LIIILAGIAAAIIAVFLVLSFPSQSRVLPVTAELTTNDTSEVTTLDVFPPGSEPYGIGYPEWLAKYWQWVILGTPEENVIDDPSGENCEIHQNGPVWFLAGTGGGEAERSCTVPSGKAILLPVSLVECSFAEGDGTTEEELRTCAKADQDLVTHIELIVDGETLSNIEDYRIQSPLFEWNLPENSIFGIKSGVTSSVSDARVVILEPLPPGKHEIHFESVLVDYTETGTLNFVEDVTYHLTITS
jgi:hypothetical protein